MAEIRGRTAEDRYHFLLSYVNTDYIASKNDLILITGSSGFIGAKVVEVLLEYGFRNLRCFVRPSSQLERLKKAIARLDSKANVELIAGDLLSPDDCAKAAPGVSIIYHLAAGFDKSFAGAFMTSALGTRNLLDAFLEVGKPKRFVNVSSFAVYSNLGLARNGILDETCPLEDVPQERFDAYGFGKLKQEEVVREYGSRYQLPYVILRPGYVFGPGKKELSGRVGISTFGFFIQVNGSNLLPLTFVDNCAEAIALAGLKPGVDGEVFNVVDDELLSGREFLKAYQNKVNAFCVRIPYPAAYVLCLLWEQYARSSKSQLPPVFNRRRCSAEWKGNRYSNRKLRERLGWRPRVPMKPAMEAFLSQFQANGTAQTSEVRGQRSEERRV
jgi:nucleoside-diphosphate-sugar epimerase